MNALVLPLRTRARIQTLIWGWVRVPVWHFVLDVIGAQVPNLIRARTLEEINQ